jgi:hypothetical protein
MTGDPSTELRIADLVKELRCDARRAECAEDETRPVDEETSRGNKAGNASEVRELVVEEMVAFFEKASSDQWTREEIIDALWSFRRE